MEHEILTEPLESNAASLHGLYTDFDAWVIKYSSIYKRSIRGTQAEKQHEENNPKQQNVDHVIIDVFAANILLKQRHTHNQPIINVKENEGFMFYDYILFKLLDNNSHRHVICRLVRSKL
ncbi:unnamed protein product [Arctia plantaginis]|uniref:Uncharacterized protein n=1 Tax=Arctia plantaginis TaxID=874455 RepID=A0A8S0ZG75_ARCPL|nr:unnamed protein product [Arctia plantaginis]